MRDDITDEPSVDASTQKSVSDWLMQVISGNKPAPPPPAPEPKAATPTPMQLITGKRPEPPVMDVPPTGTYPEPEWRPEPRAVEMPRSVEALRPTETLTSAITADLLASAPAPGTIELPVNLPGPEVTNGWQETPVMEPPKVAAPVVEIRSEPKPEPAANVVTQEDISRGPVETIEPPKKEISVEELTRDLGELPEPFLTNVAPEPAKVVTPQDISRESVVAAIAFEMSTAEVQPVAAPPAPAPVPAAAVAEAVPVPAPPTPVPVAEAVPVAAPAVEIAPPPAAVPAPAAATVPAPAPAVAPVAAAVPVAAPAVVTAPPPVAAPAPAAAVAAAPVWSMPVPEVIAPERGIVPAEGVMRKPEAPPVMNAIMAEAIVSAPVVPAQRVIAAENFPSGAGSLEAELDRVIAAGSVFAREGIWGDVPRAEETGNDGEVLPKAEYREPERRFPDLDSEKLEDIAGRPEFWASAMKTLMSAVVPWVARAVPAHESSKVNDQNPGLVHEVRHEVSGLRMAQYEMKTAVQEHSVQLKKVEEQLTRLRESIDRDSPENNELTETVRSTVKLVRLMGIGAGVLLLVLIVMVGLVLARH